MGFRRGRKRAESGALRQGRAAKRAGWVLAREIGQLEDLDRLQGKAEGDIMRVAAMGADGGIGGTYAVMPELYLKIKELTDAGKVKEASEIQYVADAIIYAMCECHGNLYAVMKEILRIRENLNIGGVRKPLPEIIPEDMEQIKKCAGMIDEGIKKYCK